MVDNARMDMNDAPRLLAGRYEVGDLIGRGGMAEVHIGYDTRLGRTVAIKILRADLARDPSFQTRFRREAQAAAGLNHPSIVAVYDTGEDQVRTEAGALQAVPFIVMEYVEGHTVRDILKGDVAAPIEEAVEITIGVLSGLEYAHHAGLVHRDIKPANVMLTPTGAVKVMDFGIARALADVGQTMTQAQAVVGTAQYLSPEQARGENVDARSDLYSAGCLLFELLTGRPPFLGDSPVSVAYQHVREAAPKPSQFASDVPPALDAVVERALQKDRNLRYSSAQEFMVDLQRALAAPNAPLPSASAAGSPYAPPAVAGAAAGALGAAAFGGAAAAATGTPGAGAAAAGAASPATAPTAVMPAGAAPGWGTVIGGPAVPPSVPPAGPQGPVVPVTGEHDLVEVDVRKRRLIQIGIAAGAVLALILLVIALVSLTSGGGQEPVGPSAETVVMPALEGVLQEDAESRLERVGLVAEIVEEASTEVDAGRVISTDPPAGEDVEVGETVTLVISTGADQVEVPDVEGLTQADAIAALEDAGLEVESVQQDYDILIQADRAIRTEPAVDTLVDTGSKVVLYVSNGKVQLPDLRTKTATEAQQILVELGLRYSATEQETTEYNPGVIITQNPAPGDVAQGSTVSVTVAKPPSTVTVPNVVGKTAADATTALTNLSLKVTQTNASSSTVPAGTVISQNPTQGASWPIGATVTITVSTGPAPTATATP